MEAQGRLLHSHWDLYDTRHVVYRPAKLTPAALEAGYWRAYRDFYRWGSIMRGASTHECWGERFRHVAYAGGWKKCEPMWDLIIRAKRASHMLPVLETVLEAFGSHRPLHSMRQEGPGGAKSEALAARSAPSPEASELALVHRFQSVAASSHGAASR